MQRTLPDNYGMAVHNARAVGRYCTEAACGDPSNKCLSEVCAKCDKGAGTVCALSAERHVMQSCTGDSYTLLGHGAILFGGCEVTCRGNLVSSSSGCKA
jgi:hypothetical protein